MKGEKTIKKLLKKSQSAYIAALDNYNKINNECRIEGFVFFIINAWELLLKARIIQESEKVKSIYYKDGKTLSLDDCLNKIFFDENNSIKKNIIDIAEFRNAAVHYYIEEFEDDLISLFKSCIINYNEHLNRWFSKNIEDKYNIPLLSLFASKSQNKDMCKLKSKYDKYAIKKIIELNNKINEHKANDNNIGYSMPIDYSVAIVKDPKNADILLKFDENAKHSGIIMNVPKDVNKTHPLTFKHISEELKQKFGKEIFPAKKLVPYDLKAINNIEKLENNQKYVYVVTDPKIIKYSDKYLQYLINKISKDENYIKSMRKKYQDLNKKRKANNA